MCKSEKWTAISKSEDVIFFEVVDEKTGLKREEQRLISALPTIFHLGGCDPFIGAFASTQPLPWYFTKIGNQIYCEI